MRHQPEIRPVARFEEKRHPRHEAEHHVLIVWIRQTDRDEKHPREKGDAVDEGFFAPNARPFVDQVAEDASEGAEDDVEEAEHGGPVAAAALFEGGEVLDVVGAEDAVDGEFGAEGAEVAAGQDEGLRGEDDREGFAERGLDDDFAAGGVEHLLFGDVGLVSETSGLLGFDGFEAELLLIAAAGAVGAGGCFVGEFAWDVNDGAGDAVGCEILLHGEVAVAPLARGGVRAANQHGNGGDNDADERNDEGHTPGNMGSQAAIVDQTVEDGGHEEVCDATSSVAEATGQGVCGTNNILVEEASGPDLTGNEATS